MVCATSTATEGYTGRFSHFKSNGFYRPFLGVQISSLGLGTYLGDSSDSADALYVEAIQTALSSGINLLDSAVNYRCMRSERNIGQALGALIQEKKISREEVVLCTKGGFIPYDGQPPAHPEKYFQEEYFKPGDLPTERDGGGVPLHDPRVPDKSGGAVAPKHEDRNHRPLLRPQP